MIFATGKKIVAHLLIFKPPERAALAKNRRRVIVCLVITEDAEAPRRRSPDRKGAGRGIPSPAGPSRISEPKQARSQATRERLLDALSDLLQTRSYGEISVADIAAAAGLTTGAVYARFG